MASDVFNNIQTVFDAYWNRDKYDVVNNTFVANEESDYLDKSKRVAEFARTLPWETYSIPGKRVNLLLFFYNVLSRSNLHDDDYKAQKQILKLYLTHCGLKDVADTVLEKCAKLKIPFLDVPYWLPFLDSPVDNVAIASKRIYQYRDRNIYKLLTISAPWLRGVTFEADIQGILWEICFRYLHLNDDGKFLKSLEPFMAGLEPEARVGLLKQKYDTHMGGQNTFDRIGSLDGFNTAGQRIEIIQKAEKLECDELEALKELYPKWADSYPNLHDLPCHTRRDTLENDDKPLVNPILVDKNNFYEVFSKVNPGVTTLDVVDRKIVLVNHTNAPEVERARKERIAVYARSVLWSSLPINRNSLSYLEFFYRTALAQTSTTRRAERTMLQIYLKARGHEVSTREIGYLVQLRLSFEKSLQLTSLFRDEQLPMLWRQVKGMRNLNALILSAPTFKQAQPWIKNTTHFLEIQTLMKAIYDHRTNHALLSFLEPHIKDMSVQDKLQLLAEIPTCPNWGPNHADRVNYKPSNTIESLVTEIQSAIKDQEMADKQSQSLAIMPPPPRPSRSRQSRQSRVAPPPPPAPSVFNPPTMVQGDELLPPLDPSFFDFTR